MDPKVVLADFEKRAKFHATMSRAAQEAARLHWVRKYAEKASREGTPVEEILKEVLPGAGIKEAYVAAAAKGIAKGVGAVVGGAAKLPFKAFGAVDRAVMKHDPVGRFANKALRPKAIKKGLHEAGYFNPLTKRGLVTTVALPMALSMGLGKQSPGQAAKTTFGITR